MRLTSIQLVLGNEAGFKKIYLPRAGGELSNCEDYRIGHWGFIKTVRVFGENEQVSGLGISFIDEDVSILKIGYGTGNYSDFPIGEDKVLRGFYGAANDEYITELGLIIEDVACMEEELLKYIPDFGLLEAEETVEDVEDEVDEVVDEVESIVFWHK